MSSREKFDARLIARELDIAYTHALRLIRQVRKYDPTVSYDTGLRMACRIALDEERGK